MRCVYQETTCRAPGQMTCFKCQNCGKHLAVASALAGKINELTATFPDCGVALPPRPIPAPGPSATTTPPAPAAPAAPTPPPYVWDPAGPGTQLKKFLSKVGIKSTENCSCNARAKLMNDRGIEWCEQNVNEIVSWLKEEAGRRKLPFLAYPTKIVVQRAIKIAKRIRDEQAVKAEESSSAAE